MPCETVWELLPLYIEGTLSEESSQTVRRHLQTCSACRAGEQLEREKHSLCSLDEESRQCALFSRRLRRKKRALRLLCELLAACALICLIDLPIVQSERERANRFACYLEGAVNRMEPLCVTLEAMEQNPNASDLERRAAALNTQCLELEGYFQFHPDYSRCNTTVWSELPLIFFTGTHGSAGETFLEDGVFTGKELAYVTACADALRQVIGKLEGASEKEFEKRMEWLAGQYDRASQDYLLS